ncbi:hypothetical protein K7W03_02165 [Sphingobium sp. PNB]|uniref:hypothetical protein n=2 Tax=Sphingobium TaxID=165695 RepID=UPI001CA389DF|nr:hypothetical protein [Sphingobium sp. PNB]MCB4858394.1 hypothetical protein [Sphingobium sp. PNB]
MTGLEKTGHWSDCAVNRELALPIGQCDCDAAADCALPRAPRDACADGASIDWLSLLRNHAPMTPLERAARAICHDFGVDPDYTMTDEDDVHVGFGFKPPHPAWTRYVSLARAAFLAVRDPSEAMIYAHSEGGLGFNDKVIEDWQAMIDAMLEEQPAISRR